MLYIHMYIIIYIIYTVLWQSDDIDLNFLHQCKLRVNPCGSYNMCFSEKKKLKRSAVIISSLAVMWWRGVGLITPNHIGRRQSDFPHPTTIYTGGAVYTAPFKTHQGSLVISFTWGPSCATVNRDVVVQYYSSSKNRIIFSYRSRLERHLLY